jgi:hypothetical protein
MEYFWLKICSTLISITNRDLWLRDRSDPIELKKVSVFIVHP